MVLPLFLKERLVSCSWSKLSTRLSVLVRRPPPGWAEPPWAGPTALLSAWTTLNPLRSSAEPASPLQARWALVRGETHSEFRTVNSRRGQGEVGLAVQDYRTRL